MTLLVSFIMIPAVLYLTIRLFYLTQHIGANHTWQRLVPSLLIISFYLFPLSSAIDFFTSGSIDVLTYPKPLTYWFWFGLIFVFQLATWFIITDVIALIFRFSSWDSQRIANIQSRSAITLFVLIFCFTAWKIHHDTGTITTNNITLNIENLPSSLHGFKIAHISDIQGDEYTGREEIARYIETVNAQDPELIIFTGDLISYGTDFIEMSAREFGKAKAAYGTYAVVGDHDYWAGTENVEQALSKQGIRLLKNENSTIIIDSTTSALITGVTQVYSKDSDPVIVDSLVSNSNATFKIFASHQVKGHLISSAQSNTYDLMVAGHTHGGQIHVPFFGMNFSASEEETDFVQGLYWEKSMPINVNNGLGFTLAPIRYKAPPAVSVIELQKK